MIHHDLVEIIYQQTGCEYLSDLKQERLRHVVTQALLKLNVSDYSLSQWEYALAYIFNEELRFAFADEVLKYLHLKRILSYHRQKEFHYEKNFDCIRPPQH